MSSYAVLCETSEEKRESWYYFIKYNGNEGPLNHLYEQLESINWKLLPDLSLFNLDLNNLVSEQTASHMCRLKLNTFFPHKKFSGKLRKIHLNFDEKDGNVTRMGKVYDALKFGGISNYFTKYLLNDVTLSPSSSETSKYKDDRFESEGEDEGEEDEEEDEVSDGHIHTDDDSISSSDSENSDAPSSEMLQQLKDFLITC